MSQNAVEPPLPSTTSYPSGSWNKEDSPSRTACTTFLTGFWRWDVPRIDVPLFASAAKEAGRIFDGPQPKRPSEGFRLSGILMSVLTGRA